MFGRTFFVMLIWLQQKTDFRPTILWPLLPTFYHSFSLSFRCSLCVSSSVPMWVLSFYVQPFRVQVQVSCIITLSLCLDCLYLCTNQCMSVLSFYVYPFRVQVQVSIWYLHYYTYSLIGLQIFLPMFAILNILLFISTLNICKAFLLFILLSLLSLSLSRFYVVVDLSFC